MADILSTPPPPPERAAPLGRKIAVALVLVVLIAGLVAHLALTLYAIYGGGDRLRMRGDEIDDKYNVKIMVGLMHIEQAGEAPDERVDVYGPLLRSVRDRERLVALCRSERSGIGPTLEQIEANDYSQFPYARAVGQFPLGTKDKAVLWDPLPQKTGKRIVGLSGGDAELVPEEEFEQYLRSHGVE
ncbi:MAG: hypothetical protein ACYTGZ_09275 [Planctomycetota bacterium]